MDDCIWKELSSPNREQAYISAQIENRHGPCFANLREAILIIEPHVDYIIYQ